MSVRFLPDRPPCHRGGLALRVVVDDAERQVFAQTIRVEGARVVEVLPHQTTEAEACWWATLTGFDVRARIREVVKEHGYVVLGDVK